MEYKEPKGPMPETINNPGEGGGGMTLVLKKFFLYVLLPYFLVLMFFYFVPLNILSPKVESRLGRWIAPNTAIDVEATAAMQSLLKEISPAQARVPLEVSVIQEDSFNAAAYPGGVIHFHAGAFRRLKNREQRAMILAHEIAHSELDHVGRRLTKSLFLLIPEMLLNAVGIPIFEVAKALIHNGFSRQDEVAADRFAAALLFQHFGSLKEGLRAYEIMGEAASWSAEIPGKDYFSTHPGTETRLQILRALEVQMLKSKKASPE